jgi:hypothetical protein
MDCILELRKKIRKDGLQAQLKVECTSPVLSICFVADVLVFHLKFLRMSQQLCLIVKTSRGTAFNLQP